MLTMGGKGPWGMIVSIDILIGHGGCGNLSSMKSILKNIENFDYLCTEIIVIYFGQI